MNLASIIAVSAACIFFAFVIYSAMPQPFDLFFAWIARIWGRIAGTGQEVVGEVVSYG